MKLNFDVVVIGSGPAGIAASIYLKRANKNVVMIDNDLSQIFKAHSIYLKIRRIWYEKVDFSDIATSMW